MFICRSPADPQLHHRLSWAWFQSDSPVREATERFIEGTPRRELPVLLDVLASLTAVPVVERVVEGEHSLLKRHSLLRKVTGSYISLSLRRSEIQESMKQNSSELLAIFHEMHDPAKLARAPHMTEHPLWKAAQGTPSSSLRQCADQILYMQAPMSQFHSVSDAHSKRRASEALFAFTKEQWQNCHSPPQARSFASMITEACMRLHLQAKLLSGTVASHPLSAMRLRTLKQALLPPQDQVSILETVCAHPGLGIDEDREQQESLSPEIFIRIVHVGIGRVKLLALPAAAASRLGTRDICITLHRSFTPEQEDGQTAFVDIEPHAEGRLSSVAILSADQTSAEAFSALKTWVLGKRIEYVFMTSLGKLIRDPVIEHMLHSKAFPESPTALEVSASDEAMQRRLFELSSQGLVTQCPAPGQHESEIQSSHWRLTSTGMKQLRMYQCIHSPALLFSTTPIKADAMDKESTPWELLVLLQHCGWQLLPAPRAIENRAHLPPHEPGSARRCFIANKDNK